jgi:hypothetical protein
LFELSYLFVEFIQQQFRKGVANGRIPGRIEKTFAVEDIQEAHCLLDEGVQYSVST